MKANIRNESSGIDFVASDRTAVNICPAVKPVQPVPSDVFQELALDLEIQCKAMQDALGELEDSRNRYAALYDFAPIGYVGFDDKGCINEINLPGAALLGKEREQLLGLPMIVFIAENSKRHFLNHLRTCRLTGEKVITELQLAVHNTAGTNVQLISTPLPVAGGEKVHYTTAIADVTSLKKAQDSLKILNAELETKVQERTIELQNTIKLMKTAYERKRRSDLLNVLINAEGLSKQTVYETALRAGIDLSAPLTCFLLIIEEWQDKSRQYWQEHFCERQFLRDTIIDLFEDDESWLAWESFEGIGLLYRGSIPDQAGIDYQVKLAGKLQEKIAVKAPELTVSVGISELASDPAALGTYYRQSQMAIYNGRKLWPERKIYHYLDLGVLQIFPCSANQDQIAPFIKRTLGKLLDYDRQKSAEYLLTLDLILEHGNLKDVAKKVYIHEKTVLLRKKRIEQILGVSLENFETRMALATALKLHKLGFSKDR